jgi:hypothetical protein
VHKNPFWTVAASVDIYFNAITFSARSNAMLAAVL